MDSKRIAVARSRVYIIVTTIAALLGTVSATGLIPQYTAAEARKHIGERATVIGKVDCIEHGRRHTDVLIGGCDLQKTLLWIVVPDEVSGSKLDCGQLRGVTIAVTGKIEFSGGTPQITINSTSQIVPRTPLNPDYFSSAMEKQSQGDFDGAIADLDRAVELTHEADIYVQRAEVKQKKGDLDGAISDYDQLLEHHTKAEYYLGRARLKTKKGDYAGVIVDSGRAIELYRHYYASHPNDHSTFVLAQAYSERGEAKEAMGDPAGAITDYENSVRNDPNAPIYKKKLKHAQAAAGPSHEQFSNNSKVTPESIAETFVQAYSGADVDAVAALYADRVDYTNSGVISNAAVRAQAKDYFARWPMRHWSLVGQVKTVSSGTTKQKVIFSASYDASDPQTNKHASGIAQETLILASDKSGAIKIVSQKEQTSKRGISQADGEEKLFSPDKTSVRAWNDGRYDGEEKLFSPDKIYSVEIMRGYGLNSCALVLFNGAKEIARIPAEVGPVGSFFEALWSPDGKYVAINKQRSSRPGGDSMWILALPTGKVLRKPDDAFWNELEERSDAYIDENLSETKEFLTLIATGWGKGGLRFRLEAGLSEMKVRYFFDGTVEPLNLRTINDWKVSKTKQ